MLKATRSLSKMASSTAIPKVHNAIRSHEIGEALNVMKFEQVDTPTISPTQILVKNHYAGVNFIENYFCTGLYKAPLPMAHGRESTGKVVAVGDSVTKFKVGDVVAMLHNETFAQYTAVEEKANVTKVPEGMDEKLASAAFLQGMTAYVLATRSYKIQKGDTVFIHAAAGGTGALLVQIAKHFGATVIGSCSTPEKVEIAKKAGCDHVINYKQESIVDRVKEITGGKGVRAVYDSIGKDTWETTMEIVGMLGTIVSFGNASGAVPPISLLTLSAKNLTITRPVLNNFCNVPGGWEEISGTVLKFVQEGILKISISKVYPLEQAPQAVADLKSGTTTGRLMIEIE